MPRRRRRTPPPLGAAAAIAAANSPSDETISTPAASGNDTPSDLIAASTPEDQS
jgi:hypothetical protein